VFIEIDATFPCAFATITEQDDALEDLSSAAERAKQVSMAVNEELDLHTKLLDDLEGDVEDTRGRLTLATRAVKRMMRRGSNCRADDDLHAPLASHHQTSTLEKRAKL
jgi:hypothetical protein